MFWCKKELFHLQKSNIYVTFIFDEFYNWLQNLSNNLSKNCCLFSSIKLAKNSVKNEFIHNGCELVLDGTGSWIFGILLAQNLVIFDVGDSSSIHFDNQKINVSIRQRKTDKVNVSDSAVIAEKTLVLTALNEKYVFF